MFHSYPIEATANNWLHEAVIEIIGIIHTRLDNGERVFTTGTKPRKQQYWLTLLPNNIDPRLRRWYGVRDRVLKYAKYLKKPIITQEQRLDILQAINNQNNIAGLLNNTSDITLINEAFPKVHEAAKELFLFCYGKLGDAGIRDAQYQMIYDSLLAKDCPFCGFGDMMNIAEASQDQDHYLAKSIYAFSAANIRNLVPMCMKCNRLHKKADDVIKNEANLRVTAFDPYACNATDISIEQSQIAEGVSSINPDWIISFVPPTPEAENWDRIFKIRERLKRDIFDECFERWFDGFLKKCLRERSKGLYADVISEDQIKGVLEDHRDSLLDDVGAGKDKFKPHLFNMLLNLFDSGNERVKSHIRDAVLGDEFR